MQGPRHHGYRRAVIKLSIVLLALLALAGCREERDQGRSAAEYQRLLDSSGRRVLVVDADGQPVAKLRKRTHKYKIYDAALTPVGFVSWERADEGAGHQKASKQKASKQKTTQQDVTVVARSIAHDDAQAIEQVSEGAYELGAKLRIEQTDRGWAVFGPDAKLAGVFQRGDADEWTLRRSYDDATVVEVTTDGAKRSLTQDGETIVKVQAGELSALELLAVELDGLSMPHRVAVGVWMERARPKMR